MTHRIVFPPTPHPLVEKEIPRPPPLGHARLSGESSKNKGWGGVGSRTGVSESRQDVTDYNDIIQRFPLRLHVDIPSAIIRIVR